MNDPDQRRVLVAYGTRPEAIKLAPVIRELQRDRSLDPVIAVSGQHREMLDQVHALFGIASDYDLDIIQPGQTLVDITKRALGGYFEMFSSVRPDVIVVQGDTSTTLAAALAAFYVKIPLVHVEAGLRTGNPFSPFPEEVNRKLTTQLATLHLAPTPRNRENLIREGVAPESIQVTGNTVIDAFLSALKQRADVGIPAVDKAIREHKRIVVVTAHRRESWGEPMAEIGRAIATLATSFPDVLFVLPAHRNPQVRAALLPPLEKTSNTLVVEPLDYLPFVNLIAGSTIVLTDSGGVQEEAPSAGKPVLVMRDATERPEAVDAGVVALVGADQDNIVSGVSRLLTDDCVYEQMANAINPYGDGRAASRTVAAIAALLGVGSRKPEFAPKLPVHHDSLTVVNER